MNRGPSGVGNPEITDSERRHADVVKFGTIHEADYKKARVRVLIGDADDDEGHLVTGWLPMAGARAGGDSDWHPLEVGEEVMVLSESGELQNGMVMPAARYSESNPAPGDKPGLWRKKFKDGGSIEYDRDSGALAFVGMKRATINVGDATVTVENGKITLSAGGQTFVVGGEGATSSGPIRGQDGLEVTGGAFTHNAKNVGSDHRHTGVQPGGGLSNVPA